MTIPNAHSIFVTGLEFVPVPRSDDDDSFTTTAEASVISISVDRKICLHNLRHRGLYFILLFVNVIFVTRIMGIFAFCFQIVYHYG